MLTVTSVIGFPLTALCLLAEALLQRSFSGTSSKGGNAACVFFLFLFIHIFDITIQCPTNVVVAEIWPTAIRSKGIGLSWFAYFVGAITYTTPSALAFKNIGWRMYMVWFSCNIVSTVIVYFYLPETANKTLEEMGGLFGDEVMVHFAGDGVNIVDEDLSDPESVEKVEVKMEKTDENYVEVVKA
jgi:sugar phosphate permease